MLARIGRSVQSLARRVFNANDPGPPNFYTTPSASRQPSQESDDEKSDPVALGEFEEHCRKLSESSNYAYDEQFDDLSQVGTSQESAAGDRTLNRQKNRYNNVIPYDGSRVRLLATDDPEDEEVGDYINANFIPGFHSKREFIATQGPLYSTQDDFWRMVWETGAKAIVMVTNLVEEGREKCSHYWPQDSGPVVYGDVKVQVVEETQQDQWTFRALSLEKTMKEEVLRRTLPQLHFTGWPDRGVPEPPDTLIQFVRFFREIVRAKTEPIVVHCRGG